jgi:chemotaxis protein MotA
MDLTTILGLSIAFGMMAASVALSGGSFSSFVNLPSLLCVIGGTLGAVLVCFPRRAIRRLPGVIRKGIQAEEPSPTKLIEAIVGLAHAARRDGLLSLDPKLKDIDDRFLRLGVQLAVDGTEPKALEDILRADMEATALRHKEGRSMFEQMGRFAPAFGLIGTLLGLVIMLGNVSDPSTIGSGMAVALVTTVYGAVLANGSLLPMAEKLSQLSKRELITCEIALRGILAMQAGEHPRLIEQKLRTFLPPEARTASPGPHA